MVANQVEEIESNWNEEQKMFFFFGVQPVVNYKNLVVSAW
jgi:hypothetical protein